MRRRLVDQRKEHGALDQWRRFGDLVDQLLSVAQFICGKPFVIRHEISIRRRR